ncbi:peptidylprolyl isomerase [Salidesulfovibrio brasiliensis]|uniref:peptidylprolyl isomerase n=1 Tax=Salidesulfovibrio brasiliensis TaxID=221711 RepID=UPI0006D2AA13|nr:peptidylprolyl isomerase [Salidesulfovibrio brasiliensis]
MLDIMRQNASSWIVKILFGVIIIVFVFAFGMSSLDNNGDPILAYVDEEPIPRKEFESTYARTTEALRRSQPNMTAEQLASPAVKQMVFNELVNRMVILKEAERLGIAATDKEVARGIASIPAFWNANKQFDKEIYQAALRSQRMKPAEFEANYRIGLIMDKMRGTVSATAEATPELARQIYDWVLETATVRYIPFNVENYTGDVTVTDEQIAAYYEEHKDRFTRPAMSTFEVIAFTPPALAPFQEVSDEEAKQFYEASPKAFTEPEQAKARHILIATEQGASKEAIEEARKKAEEVLARLKKGEDFGKLALTYSEGPSASKGGELGWFPRGVMDPNFEQAAFDLKVGEISEPVKTPFGWHIIKLEERKEANKLPFDEVKGRIKTTLAQEKAADQTSDMLDQAMDRLVSGMSIEDIASELGILSNTTQPLPKQAAVQYLGMTPEAADILFALPKGESLKTPLGVKDGYLLARKIEDIEPQPVPLPQVKENIVKQLQAEGAAEMAKAEAEKALEALTGDDAEAAAESYAKRMVVSEPFNRRGPIPGIGENQELVTAAFGAEPGQWFPKVFQANDGFIVAAMDHLIPAPADEWNKDNSHWVDTASQKYGDEVFQAFIYELRSKANVELVRPDLLN